MIEHKKTYFIGVGGIGMSAIARYYNAMGVPVYGYDKTETSLTKELQSEGIHVRYEPSLEFVESLNENDLIVYTPAVPKDFPEFEVLSKRGLKIHKRAEVLGMLSRSHKGLAVAGTHGKTTTSSLLAHILMNSSDKVNAFLGGITSNYNSNVIINEDSPFVVLEADEFDRSFLHLSPFASILTSTDADHLDIYGESEVLKTTFQEYIDLINPEGFFICQKDIQITTNATKITYGLNEGADAIGAHLRYENGRFLFDYSFDSYREIIELGIPGVHNAENAVAAITMGLKIGMSIENIKDACASFKGVKRRFEYHLKKENNVYIDDYAHHPTELKAFFDSLDLLYPNQEKTVIFQPHLFSRTRDFRDGFVEQLARVDHLVIMPIYPAREEPIPGVTSKMLANKIGKEVLVLNHEECLAYIQDKRPRVLATVGAGNIDRLVPEVVKIQKELN